MSLTAFLSSLPPDSPRLASLYLPVQLIRPRSFHPPSHPVLPLSTSWFTLSCLSPPPSTHISHSHHQSADLTIKKFRESSGMNLEPWTTYGSIIERWKLQLSLEYLVHGDCFQFPTMALCMMASRIGLLQCRGSCCFHFLIETQPEVR